MHGWIVCLSFFEFQLVDGSLQGFCFCEWNIVFLCGLFFFLFPYFGYYQLGGERIEGGHQEYHCQREGITYAPSTDEVAHHVSGTVE